MSAQVTLMGVIAEPQFKFTHTGKAIIQFSMVTKRRAMNRDTNQWEDHEETWWQVTAWENLAENAAETLAKGMAVIVVGRTYMDTYTGKDGSERTALKVLATAIGPDLRRASATVRKVERKQAADAAAGGSDPFDQPF